MVTPLDYRRTIIHDDVQVELLRKFRLNPDLNPRKACSMYVTQHAYRPYLWLAENVLGSWWLPLSAATIIISSPVLVSYYFIPKEVIITSSVNSSSGTLSSHLV